MQEKLDKLKKLMCEVTDLQRAGALLVGINRPICRTAGQKTAGTSWRPLRVYSTRNSLRLKLGRFWKIYCLMLKAWNQIRTMVAW